VDVPQMRSNISWIFLPVPASIRASILTVQLPRIPPPSMHKMRTPRPAMGRRPTACRTISFSPRMASARVAMRCTAGSAMPAAPAPALGDVAAAHTPFSPRPAPGLPW